MPPEFPKPASAKGLRAGALAGLRCGIYGPGRVGTSLGRWCADHGGAVDVVVSRSGRRPAPLAALSPRWLRPDEVGDLPHLDLLLLTVSDDALAGVARQLADAAAPGPEVVLHAAGCLDAEVLAPLDAAGVATGSLHPLRAFPEPVPHPDPSTVYAVDGAAPARSLARRLVEAWGGRAVELAGQRRVLYHLAASLAAGGVTTLLATVGELMQRADLPADARDEILQGYFALLRGAVDAAEDVARRRGTGALADAITGPAARGDEATLRRHREALAARAPELLATVDALWRETERQVRRRAGGSAESR